MSIHSMWLLHVDYCHVEQWSKKQSISKSIIWFSSLLWQYNFFHRVIDNVEVLHWRQISSWLQQTFLVCINLKKYIYMSIYTHTRKHFIYKFICFFFSIVAEQNSSDRQKKKKDSSKKRRKNQDRRNPNRNQD